MSAGRLSAWHTAAQARRDRGPVGLVQGVAMYIGAVFGTDVIALPALAAIVAGPASLIAWVGMAMLCVPLAMTFATLGARLPDPGGAATYVRHAFGLRAAAVTGWFAYFGTPVSSSPASAMFAGSYVAAATGTGRGTVMVVTGSILIVVLSANAFGVKLSGRVQVGLMVLLISLLAVATVSTLPHADPTNLHPFAPHGWLAVGSAVVLLAWSFAGWEAVAPLAGEFARSERDMHRAGVIAVGVVGVLYMALVAATILVLGPNLQGNAAPLAEPLSLALGGSAAVLAALAALVLTLGTMNAYNEGATKLGAVLARDVSLPSWLARDSEAGAVAPPQPYWCWLRRLLWFSRWWQSADACRGIADGHHGADRRGVRAEHGRCGAAATAAQYCPADRSGSARQSDRNVARYWALRPLDRRAGRRSPPVPGRPDPPRVCPRRPVR
jgi:amino acid efflux transporter